MAATCCQPIADSYPNGSIFDLGVQSSKYPASSYAPPFGFATRFNLSTVDEPVSMDDRRFQLTLAMGQFPLLCRTADPSAAAIVTAILSITLQLAERIKHLHDFFITVTDAPQGIRETVQELRLLGAFLERLADPALDPIATEALCRCNAKVTALFALLKQWGPVYTSTSRRVRTWSSFKATLPKDRLDKLRLSLEETKLTLILIRQNLSE